MSYVVNRRDLEFILFDMLDLESLLQADRYAQFDRATITQVLDLAQSIAEDHYLPSAGALDANEPKFVDGKVDILPDVAVALRTFADAGFFAASFDEAEGGLQLPYSVTLLLSGMFTCANLGIANYSFLTMAAAAMLSHVGSDAQKQRYLKPMLEGRWFGTMCLSETQAGSSLSDIRTRADPLGEGRYAITGSKMWISGGDHDLSENIVHMVLARVAGAPPGVKGISLFIVPKFRVREDGTLGDRNDVSLAGLNHKMGHRGTTNCLLNFGEAGACEGWLVGEPHQGLAAMFHMMNEARISVGMGSVMSGLAGYLYSLDYARTRTQGRLPGDKDPTTAPVPIIDHADIRRMLLNQKVAVEGGLALCAFCALLVDQQGIADTAKDREDIGLLLELLTPIAKSWPSEHCLEANKDAIQILGGYGYTREYPVERFYRDNRLNHIHEGTYAIHGIDLLGRKVRLRQGAAVDLLIARMEATMHRARSAGILAEEATALANAIATLRQTTRAVVASDDLRLGLANATLYLDGFGTVVLSWIWLWQALVALDAADPETSDFCAGKVSACRYIFRYMLPHALEQLRLVATLDDTCLAMRADAFVTT